MVRAYAKTPNLKARGVVHFKKMLNLGIYPNKFTYPFVLKACAGLGNLNFGKQVHGSALKYGLDNGINTRNTMVHMYCCIRGGVEFARQVFDEMVDKDSVTWSAMIGGYEKSGMSSEAVGLFREMQVLGVPPDEVTMVLVLSACSDLGALELGKWVESYVDKGNFSKSVELCNAIIDMFVKCGDVDKAIKLFRGMKKRTIVSWTCVIVGFAMHGRGLEAIALFEEMRGSGTIPDDVTFIGLLSACSHSGLVDEGRSYFSLMVNEFSIVLKIEHYGCMVDLLSRAGLVNEALEFIQAMPIEPNPVIWRTLIAACRAQGELDLGERIMKKLIRKDPCNESNYVMLSNIYAKMSQWDRKNKIREEMDNKGLRKVPGSTMIELNGEIYEFVAGDRDHIVQYKEIYEMVDEIGREMRKAGYIPTATEVLLDIDEEDKEGALNLHSEKLAISFALLKTPPGTPIRIVKNLRVCVDCHSATKFISKVYNREILVRDRNRFHLFKDGKCSCKDFW